MKLAPKDDLLGTVARLRIVPEHVPFTVLSSREGERTITYQLLIHEARRPSYAHVEKTPQFSYVPGPNEMLIPIETYRYLCGGTGNPIYDRLMWGARGAPIGGLLS